MMVTGRCKNIGWPRTETVLPSWGQALTWVLGCGPCQNTAFGFSFL